LNKDLKLNLYDKITQTQGLIGSNMGGEKVMLSISNGKYYNLGEIGGRIWDGINKPVQINQLVSLLSEEYEVDPIECEKEVITFLETLLQEGIIQIVDSKDMS
jgi:hypothetical protein